METRFFYNPVTKEFLNCGTEDHAIFFHNKKRDVKTFDKYIRGIISNKVLYLRLFYPLADIDEKTFLELKEYSTFTLIDNESDIKKILRKEGYTIKRTFYSVTNEDLRGKLTNI
jgi:hypothetical protein